MRIEPYDIGLEEYRTSATPDLFDDRWQLLVDRLEPGSIQMERANAETLGYAMNLRAGLGGWRTLMA